MNESLKKSIEYIKNTGGNPKKEWFIEDHCPIGEDLLCDLLTEKLIIIKDGRITLDTCRHVTMFENRFKSGKKW